MPYVSVALRGLLAIGLFQLALAGLPPGREAALALIPFLLFGLLVRIAALVVIGLVAASGQGLTPLGLGSVAAAALLLAWGAGRWALDPLRPMVLWARGVGRVAYAPPDDDGPPRRP